MCEAREIQSLLESLADPKYIEQYQYFFKTAPGQYGEGDKFLGIRNPVVRSVVKQVWKETSLNTAAELARSEWHEIRLCGLLIMVEYMLKAVRRHDEETMERVWKVYIELHPYINNWDLVDLSAIKIAGNWERFHPEDTLLDEWARLDDTHLWQRRIAMVSTWMTLRYGDFTKVFERAALLIHSKQDLLHKVSGWMLREVYGHNGSEQVRDFLYEHIGEMPSVMLSYACEKMSPSERQIWRERRKNSR